MPPVKKSTRAKKRTLRQTVDVAVQLRLAKEANDDLQVELNRVNGNYDLMESRRREAIVERDEARDQTVRLTSEILELRLDLSDARAEAAFLRDTIHTINKLAGTP